jgi:hypothetical protein
VCETDAQALALATFYIQRFKQPEQRVTQIVVKPRTDPKRLFPQVLGRRVRDLIRVIVHPLGGGTITQDCHIAGITHEITKDDWTTTFDLWSATVYTGYSTSRFDVGQFDRHEVLLLERGQAIGRLLQPEPERHAHRGELGHLRP